MLRVGLTLAHHLVLAVSNHRNALAFLKTIAIQCMDVQRHTNPNGWESCFCCVSQYIFHVHRLQSSGDMVTQTCQWVCTLISRACSSKSDIFINTNLCCLPLYKFHVYKLQGLGDTVTQGYQCIQNHETQFTSWTDNSK